MRVVSVRELTRNKILIQVIHPLHILLPDLEASNISVLYDSLLLHTLGQGNKTVLQTPPYHQLSTGTAILLRKI